MSALAADRNLLYGVIALQMGMISRDDLIKALHTWVTSKQRPLGDILQDQKALSRSDRPAVEYAVRRQLEKSQYDAAQCLTHVDNDLLVSLNAELNSFADFELRQTLRHVENAQSKLATEIGETRARAAPAEVEFIDLQTLLEEDKAREEPRFRILRSHQRGGLGELFIAWDEEVGREVALKEIRREYVNNERLRARFMREAEINGNLEHPGIVPVYGKGAYQDGRPFYAMRFVEGETLQSALTRLHLKAKADDTDEWEVDLRKLLRKIIAVCQAISYAHSRGIIHRDLKPLNILLGPFGETLLIDWGLAKPIDAPDATGNPTNSTGEIDPIPRLSAESSLISTQDGETLGSPQFMSPEQARGENEHLGKATDIYSLGATLYAVLTGDPPFLDNKLKIVLNKVARGEFPPPQERNPKLPKPLDAICLKAMRLEQADRYATVDDLANDLQCWLDDRPVSVYEDPAAIRLMRWSRHHRSFVAAGLALLLAGLAGLSIFTAYINGQKKYTEVLLKRETSARNVAESALQGEVHARVLASNHLNAGMNLIEELVTAADRQLTAQASLTERKRLLDSTTQFLRRVQSESPNDGTIKANLALISRRIANLERLAGNDTHAEQLYNDAIAALEQLNEPENTPANLRDQLAEALLDHGQALLEQGKTAPAATRFERAREISRQNRKHDPDSQAFARTYGRSLLLQGTALFTAGEPDAAPTLRFALETLTPLADTTLPALTQESLKRQPLPFNDQVLLTATMSQLGVALLQSGSTEEGLDLQRDALNRLDELKTKFRGLVIPDLDLHLAEVQARLAESLLEQPGATAEALERLNSTVPILQNLADRNPEIPLFRIQLADALSLRARARPLPDQADAAVADAEKACSLLEPLVQNQTQVPRLQALHAQALFNRAQIEQTRQASPDSVRKMYERSLESFENALKALPRNSALIKARNACQARLKAL